MIKIRLNHKGQNMAEYAIIFGIVIAAAVGISALIKEGIQDRVVSEIRKLGDNVVIATGPAYDIVATTTRAGTSSSAVRVATGGLVTENQRSNGTTVVSENYRAGL